MSAGGSLAELSPPDPLTVRVLLAALVTPPVGGDAHDDAA